MFARWGRTECPNTEGTRTVYSGRAAGSPYYQQGGASDHLCLPDKPEYGEEYRPLAQGYSPVAGAEYVTYDGEPLEDVGGEVVPCTVCHTSPRSSLLVIPARLSCPDSSWTREYSGFLLSSAGSAYGSTAVCVDKYAESVCDGEDVNGSRLYHMEAECNGLECPPYCPEKELACVVCTK